MFRCQCALSLQFFLCCLFSRLRSENKNTHHFVLFVGFIRTTGRKKRVRCVIFELRVDDGCIAVHGQCHQSRILMYLDWFEATPIGLFQFFLCARAKKCHVHWYHIQCKYCYTLQLNAEYSGRAYGLNIILKAFLRKTSFFLYRSRIIIELSKCTGCTQCVTFEYHFREPHNVETALVSVEMENPNHRDKRK